MENNLLIKIIYNGKKYFLDTFESVLKQTYLFWEWIIVDDCSNDETFDFVKDKISGDKRIVLLKTKNNCGAAAARNIGIENASGRFIAFLDADDLWKPNKLETQVKYMLENECAFSYSNYDLLKTNGSIVELESKFNEIDYKTLLKTNDIGCLTVMYDTEKIGKVYMPIDAPKKKEYTIPQEIKIEIVRGNACHDSTILRDV